MAGREGSRWLVLSAVIDESGHLGINNELKRLKRLLH